MCKPWIERRGIVLRADGEAVVVTRGGAQLLPIAVAVEVLLPSALGIWLAGMACCRFDGHPV